MPVIGAYAHIMKFSKNQVVTLIDYYPWGNKILRGKGSFHLEHVTGIAFSARNLRQQAVYFFECEVMRAFMYEYDDENDTLRTFPNRPILLQPEDQFYKRTVGWSGTTRNPPYHMPVDMTVDGDEYLWISVYEAKKVRIEHVI